MTDKTKKKIKELFSFISAKIGLLSMALLVSIIWGYIVRGDSLTLCLSIGFGGFILIDLAANSYQKFAEDQQPKPKKEKSEETIDMKATPFVVTDEDLGESDPNYEELFLKNASTQNNSNVAGSFNPNDQDNVNSQIQDAIDSVFGRRR